MEYNKECEVFNQFVNTFLRNEEGLKVAFNREHRTRQQAIFKVMCSLIEHMSTDEFRTDGRNEMSKDVAKKLIRGFEHETMEELIKSGEKKENAEKYSKYEWYKPSKCLSLI